jgi:ubiquitin fusion degradation protein 1
MLNFFENFLLTPYKPFEQQYRCYSAAFKQRDDINKGGKIILPASALEQLASLKIQYPMMFEIFNDNKKTHCGVLEFTAEEGKCILPYWIMKNINVDEGDLVKIKNVALPTGTYVKLKPIGQNNFLNISNPKAVLETRLRNFACLTKGDKIIIEYNDHDYELEVIEVKPNNKEAISIVEADVILDFDTSEENFNKGMDKNLTKTLPKKY